MIRFDTPAGLQAFMHAPYPLSDEQFRAVTAPLEPGVVIAGAGSGKTTLMAARVVWLVATGQVAPEQVLGLTFTTKAAAELGSRVRDGLRAAGVLSQPDECRGLSRMTTLRRCSGQPLRPTTPMRRRCSLSTGCASATSRTLG